MHTCKDGWITFRAPRNEDGSPGLQSSSRDRMRCPEIVIIVKTKHAI